MTIFIGHGKSLVWHELRDFLEKRLHLSVDEFNSVPVAGIPTVIRLEEMLNAAAFAFLVMTAEDELPDGKLHARLNVVHEAGLFQGRLGFKKTIILLEEGCEEFSNIHGLLWGLLLRIGVGGVPTRSLQRKDGSNIRESWPRIYHMTLWMMCGSR
jgi:predicted nucleotide-binding protein